MQSQFDPVQKDTSYAIIACLVMTEHLNLVREFKLPNKKYVGATSIRRLRPNANEFVVGVYQGLVVLEFDERQGFREVQYFENVHSHIIDDIAVFNNNVYSVCRRDKFVHHILINKF